MLRELICFLPQQQPILIMTRKSCHSFKYGVVRRAAKDAMKIQTSDNKLRKKALTETPTYVQFIKADIAMELSKAQAEQMEKTTVDERDQLCR